VSIIPETPRCQIYIITPPKLSPVVFADHLARALDSGYVSAVQLRLEEAEDDHWRLAIEKLMPVAQDSGAAFIVNNRVDLAAEMDADGVHLGMSDTRLTEARRLLGPDKIIGASCLDSKHLGMTAAERGADYVSFGPFFTSRSPFYPDKAYAPKYMVSPNILTWWSTLMETPCVAAGGIKPGNCGDLVKAGADFICASTSIWDYDGGAAAAIADFQAAIDKVQPAQAKEAG
jgi:thiamine-phosphate pyrophosphorylase